MDFMFMSTPPLPHQLFEAFSLTHLLTLVFIACAAAVGLFFLERKKDERFRARFAMALAISIVVMETGRIAYTVFSATFSVSSSLPLHLCGIMAFMTPVALLMRNRVLHETAFFLGISGALQPLLTPDVLYTFPHILYIITFYVHGALVFAGLYILVIRRFRPTLFSLLRVFLAGNGMLVVVYFFNLATGSNYMFLMGPSPNPSLIDLFISIFGPPPLHIIGFELMGMAMAGLLYFMAKAVDMVTPDIKKSSLYN